LSVIPAGLVHADQFGGFTYVEGDDYVAITDCPDGATGDVIIPSEIVGKPVTVIGYVAFGGCSNVTSITIPESVLKIGDSAFIGCSNLTSIIIPQSVLIIGARPFYRCTNLTAITVDADNSVYSSVDGVLFDKNRTKLVQYPVGKAGAYSVPGSVIGINYGAFHGCERITSVSISDKVISLGERPFSDCGGLAAITVDAANPTYSSVDGVLFDKNQTTLIAFPFVNAGHYTVPESVTSIGDHAFEDRKNLTDLTIPDSVKNIGYSAFNSCIYLTSVTIPDSVTSIGNFAFTSCRNLASITIGSGLTSIGRDVFRSCRNLTGVTIGSSVTSIGFGAFRSCINLTSVTITDSTKIIADHAFHGCTSLINVTIPDSVTSIGNYAFGGCSSLFSVLIGSGVNYIEDGAFLYCLSLSAIYFEGNAPNLGNSESLGIENAIVYYLPGTTGWGTTFGDLSSKPIRVLPVPFIGGAPVDGLEDWFYSVWFGFYAVTLDPWLFHAEHELIYCEPESTSASMYFYDDAMGTWWWTRETVYPFIYVFDPPVDNAGTDIEAGWLWYFEGTETPRVFGAMTGDHAGSFLYYDP